LFAALGFAFSFFFPLLRNFCAIPQTPEEGQRAFSTERYAVSAEADPDTPRLPLLLALQQRRR